MRAREIFETKENHLTEYTGDGPLYHGTDLIALPYIIHSNYLMASIDTNNPKGVSLTWNKRIAAEFADRSSLIFRDNHYSHFIEFTKDWNLGKPPMTGTVLELDIIKLRQHYKLIHYDDDTFFQDDEEEVRVLTPEIRPLSDFLTGIYLNPADMHWYAEFLKSAYAAEDHPEGDQTAAYLMALSKHPLLKAL